MAEYEACILGIKMAVDMNVYELLVIGDSDPFDPSGSRRMGCEEPKDCTLCTICAKPV